MQIALMVCYIYIRFRRWASSVTSSRDMERVPVLHVSLLERKSPQASLPVALPQVSLPHFDLVLGGSPQINFPKETKSLLCCKKSEPLGKYGKLLQFQYFFHVCTFVHETATLHKIISQTFVLSASRLVHYMVCMQKSFHMVY